MSEIANALKKIKHSDKKIKFSYGAVSKVSAFSINKAYLFIFLISVVLVVGYFYLKSPSTNKMVKDYVNINENTAIFNSKVAQYEKMKKNDVTSPFYSALVKKDYDLATKIISQIPSGDIKKKKFEGVYYFAKNDYSTAKAMLEDYIKFEKDITVMNLLSYIYYSYGDYVKAGNLLFKEDVQNGNVFINKAILYEKTGNLKEALEYYEKGLPLLSSDLLKFKVKIKIKSIELSMGIQ